MHREASKGGRKALGGHPTKAECGRKLVKSSYSENHLKTYEHSMVYRSLPLEGKVAAEPTDEV